MRILDDLKALGPQSRKGTGYWLRNLAPDGSAFSALKLQRPPMIVARWTQTLAYIYLERHQLNPDIATLPHVN